MSRVEDVVRALEDESFVDARAVMHAVSSVGGGWTMLQVNAAGKRLFYALGAPGDRNPSVPWALPSGLVEYDLSSALSILRQMWAPLARRWLNEHRNRPFAREEL